MATRVLHLIDAASPQASPTTLSLLALSLDVSGVRPRVLLLGGPPLARAGEAAGLSGAERLALPARRVLLGAPRLARRIRAQGEPGVIHCWSVGALEAACLLRPRTPRVLTLTQPPDAQALRRLQRLRRRLTPRRCALLATDPALAERLVAAGLPAESIHVEPPAAEPGWYAAGARRPHLRRAWGLEDKATRAIALLGDPPTDADAYTAALAISLAREALSVHSQPPPLALLVHPDQRHRTRAQSMLEEVGSPVRLVQCPQLAEPWQALPACDAAVAVDEAASGLSLRWALASGRPVAAIPSAAARQVIEHERTGLIAASDRPRDLAHQIQRLINEPQFARGLADEAARPEHATAAEQAWRQRVGELYTRLTSNGAQTSSLDAVRSGWLN